MNVENKQYYFCIHLMYKRYQPPKKKMNVADTYITKQKKNTINLRT